MNKTTKGALAAGTAAVLLMGGVGTIAYWTDEQAIASPEIDSGTLKFGEPVCDSDWTLDSGDGALGSGTIVPGDSLTRQCSFPITATGDHLSAELTAGPAGFNPDNALTDELDLVVTYALDDGAAAEYTGPIPITPGSHTLVAMMSVDFDFEAATNDSKEKTAHLSQIDLALTQVDSHTP